jgi:hypothetical protein
MHVFLIDIPFKGSQILATMMSKVTAVSYLHSGVNDSAVHVTAVSLTLLKFFPRNDYVKSHSGVIFAQLSQ